MIDDDGFTDERPQTPGTYWACTPDGEWEVLVIIGRGPRGLVCIADDRRIPPMLLSQIPPGSLLWRRE
ncbi:MAG TPA: hypothetical protein HA263_09095 [Methanoregulaceae archaeon]|nr:hypothetical protein [Methanoregulaceae archaeon]